MKNIFVVGLEPFNLALLEGVPGAEAYRFYGLLAYGDAVGPNSRKIGFPRLLDLAEKQLAAFTESIDAIIGYWDFPTSAMTAVLRRRHGLPGPNLEAVATCEHKYWSRIEQQHVIPEHVPGFRAVDPFTDTPLNDVGLPFPFWIKPIKAHSSYLGFKIRDEADFDAALPIIRANIGEFGVPFDDFLSLVEVPDMIAGVGGHYCIAEEIISQGEQCTLEGYVHQGEIVVYGVVDSIRSGEHLSSFARYQYPSLLPKAVQARMIETAKAFIAHIGYDNAPFNVEFYWNRGDDRIWILEVNTRISKSHCPLFMMVDGASHHKVAIDIALGRRPDFPFRCGAHKIAAKFMFRIFKDGVVEQVPGQADIEKLRDRFPDALIRVLVKEGTHLSHLAYQDSYSYELAEIFLGADSETELLNKYAASLEVLPFKIGQLKMPAQ